MYQWLGFPLFVCVRRTSRLVRADVIVLGRLPAIRGRPTLTEEQAGPLRRSEANEPKDAEARSRARAEITAMVRETTNAYA
jgi:hypothetical protein